MTAAARTRFRLRRATAAWPAHLAMLGITVLAELMLFARDAYDMAALWWGTSTYQHCLFVVPIVAWLLWQRREEVSRVEAAGWLPGLVLVFGAALLWLMGEAGGVALVRHAALVFVIQATAIAVLGPAVARAVMFPLFYLVFLVPFGDEFVPAMQTVTAKMTMVLLHLAGVPATIDGVFITIPKGWFEVAEACSGVKFLVAMVAYGALVAQICFHDTRRRVLFMVAATIVPILANGVRAFGTIYAAHLTSVKFATGFDHIVYGWVFFALVMGAIMLASRPFFDRRVGDLWLDGKTFQTARGSVPVVLMMPLAALLAALPVGWNAWASSSGRVALPIAIELPAIPGWQRLGEPPVPAWSARFDGADHRLQGRYGDAAGHKVDLAVALYGWQDKGRAIVAYGQGTADPDGHWRWASDAAPVPGGRAERLLGPGAAPREAVTFWIVDGSATGSRSVVKLKTLLVRLAGSDQSAATVIVSAEGENARASIDAFLAALGPPERLAAALIARARGR